MKQRKMKTFTANSVDLNVRKELRAPNGSRQFFIVVRAPTKKRVHELFIAAGEITSLRELNNFNGLIENACIEFTPPEDEVIYFFNDHTGTPKFREYLKLSDWKV